MVKAGGAAKCPMLESRGGDLVLRVFERSKGPEPLEQVAPVKGRAGGWRTQRRIRGSNSKGCDILETLGQNVFSGVCVGWGGRKATCVHCLACELTAPSRPRPLAEQVQMVVWKMGGSGS